MKELWGSEINALSKLQRENAHLQAEVERLQTIHIEEFAPLRENVEGVREAALGVGGVDHTTDSATIIRQLAQQRDELQAKLDVES